MISFFGFFSCIFTFRRGQSAPAGNSPPQFGPSAKMDFELEMVRVLNSDACADSFT